MDRLQKKCAIGSAGGHLLLALLLFIGPAFLSSAPTKTDNPQILDIVPSILVDAAISGGGNPNAKPPPSALPAPTPPSAQSQPKPEPPVPEPTPPKETAKPNPPEQDAADSFELKETKRKPQISLTPVIRKPSSTKNSKEPSTSESDKQSDDRRRKAADMLASAARSLRDDVSSGISLDPLGPGGGGPVYAGYDQFVRSIYYHAWVPPEDTASDNAIVKATVTIGSDGNVITWSLLNPSGDSSVDSSVRRALERVTFVAPFPEGAKDKQRVYTIKFDLKAKRLKG